MRICLFEQRPETLAPLTLTRPVFDLRCGLTTLGEKQRRHFGLDEWGVLLRPWLQNLFRLQHSATPVNDPAWLPEDGLVLVNGRWLPPPGQASQVFEPCMAMADGQVAYLVLANKHLRQLTPDNYLLHIEHWRNTLPEKNAGGCMIDYPWQLVEHNGSAIAQDFETLKVAAHGAERVHLVGPADQLWIDPSAKIEPLVVADVSAGPVIIEEHAVVTAFTRLEGPCVVGPHTRVLGAKIRAGTTLGPHCRVGGEVEASIIHGYGNKYHEGFLGHSYVGEWVNLGAGSHNSDLRNDYGEVTVTVAGQAVATGQTKVGCFLGDHTKTGLGTLLNTGTSVGVFCNLLPAGGFTPNYVPSFLTWWKGALREGFRIERLLETARQVMKRRGAFLTSEHVVLYRRLLEETALERRRLLAGVRPNSRRQAA